MEQVKTIEALKDKLLGFEKEAQQLIIVELLRLNRAVRINELAFVPFIDEVEAYVEAIKLDSQGKVIIETSFEDVEEKDLTAFISDNEITHWQLIELLEMLMKIT